MSSIFICYARGCRLHHVIRKFTIRYSQELFTVGQSRSSLERLYFDKLRHSQTFNRSLLELDRLGVIVKPIGRSNLIAINLRTQAFQNTWTQAGRNRLRDRRRGANPALSFSPITLNCSRYCY